MALLFLDPGLLRRRAVLKEPVVLPDDSGGAATAWREVAEVSVHVEPVSVRLRERHDSREATVTHRITLRHRSDIDRGMVFWIGGRRLAIRSLHDPDDSGRYLVCRCEEER